MPTLLLKNEGIILTQNPAPDPGSGPGSGLRIRLPHFEQNIIISSLILYNFQKSNIFKDVFIDISSKL
jgi:hypothetical protein